MHKKCSGLKCLTKDPDYRCTQCKGTACPLDSRPQKVGPDKLEGLASFYYVADMLSAAGGCELSTTTRENHLEEVQGSAQVLSSCHLSFKTCGRVYSSCAELNAPCQRDLAIEKKPNLQRLQRNDRAMIRQICNVRPQDIVTTRSSELRAAWHQGCGPHSEGEKTPMVWTCGTLQGCSQDSL